MRVAWRNRRGRFVRWGGFLSRRGVWGWLLRRRLPGLDQDPARQQNRKAQRESPCRLPLHCQSPHHRSKLPLPIFDGLFQPNRNRLPAVKSLTSMQTSRSAIDAHASLPVRKLSRHGIAASLASSACPGCQCCSYYDPIGADGQSCGGDFARIRWNPSQAPGRGWVRGLTPAITTSRSRVTLSRRSGASSRAVSAHLEFYPSN